MERQRVSLTPDEQSSDYDDTGTTSMLSSLLGNETPKFIHETGFEPKLMDIPEIEKSHESVERPRFLQKYDGPGKVIDATVNASVARLSQDVHPMTNNLKTVFGSIQKLKTSSHQSLGQINLQSNTAISQVLGALHTHDQTMKSLKDALNEIDIVTEQSSMERKSTMKLGSIREINKSLRVLNKESTVLNKESTVLTKEWVQNEVEIQIEYLRKSLNIDQIQKVLLNLKKEKIEDTEYSSHIKELIKHEVNDQVEEIKSSSQNLDVLEKVEDFVSSRNDQLRVSIQEDLKNQVRLILQDETEKIISTVSERTPAYITESELQLAIQDALVTVNDDDMSDKIIELNEKVELLRKNSTNSKSNDQEKRISKLEEFLSKSRNDSLKDISGLEKKIFDVLEFNSKTQERQLEELKVRQENEELFKKQLLSRLVALEGSKSSGESTNNSEFERQMGNLENQIKEIASREVSGQEKSDISIRDDASGPLYSRLSQLENTISELKAEWKAFSKSMATIPDLNKKRIEAMEKKVDQFQKVNATIQTLSSSSSEKSMPQGPESFSNQTRSSLLRTDLRNVKNSESIDSELVTEQIDSGQISESKEESTISISIKKIQSDVGELQQFFQQSMIVSQNIGSMNQKIIEVCQKVDKLDSESLITKETSLREIADLKNALKDHQIKAQEQISNESPKSDVDVQDEMANFMSIRNEVEDIKKNLQKSEVQINHQQSQQPSLDINTRLAVLTARVSEVESKAKDLYQINPNDFNQDIHELKQKMEKLESLERTFDQKISFIEIKQNSDSEKIDESKNLWDAAKIKIGDIESTIKTILTPGINKLQSDYCDRGELLRTMDNGLRSLQEEKSSAQLESWISSHLLKYREEIDSKLENKVDNDVLEELVKHLATRDELKKVAKKKLGIISERKSTENVRSNSNIRTNVLDESDENRTNIAQHQALKKELEIYFADQIKSLEIRLQSQQTTQNSNDLSYAGIEKKDMQSIKKFAESLINDKMKLIISNQKSDRARKEGSPVPDDEFGILEQKIRRDFDEKLFLLCSDLSSCKNMLASQLYEPFHRCAQWIWKSGHLKLGSAVPWNIQTRNTDEENFHWEQDNFNIKVAEAGLYEITLAFFTKTKPSVQLIVNGESIMSAINSPSYIVHHSSGYVIDGNGKMQEGVVSGLSLVDFLALPSKSTLAIHYHGVKKQSLGHGFLGLRKL